MSSTYTVSPPSVYDHRNHPKNRNREPHHIDATTSPTTTSTTSTTSTTTTTTTTNGDNHNYMVTTGDSQLLSPYSSHIRSNSASPTGFSNTPAESTSSLSVYQSSDFSSDDPFFGVNFDDPDSGTPAFLDDPLMNLENTEQLTSIRSSPFQSQTTDDADYSLSSGKPPLEPNFSSLSGHMVHNSGFYTGFIPAEEPRAPSNTYRSDPILADSNPSAPQLTPDTNGGGWSSDDSLAPAAITMASQSPRVTVSLWGKDEEHAADPVARSLAPGSGSHRTVRMGISTDVLSTDTAHGSDVSRDTQGVWVPDNATGHHGLGPEDRPSLEILSINELAADRQVTEKNQQVAAWVSVAVEKTSQDPAESTESVLPAEENDDISPDDIPLGHTTENRYMPGQTYYQTEAWAGGITPTDLEIIQQSRNCGDAPMLHPISQIGSTRHQPESSQAAIEMFESMYRDSDSVVSRAATWGTRRRSLPSILDTEGVICGNFLKKLSITRGNSTSRRPSLLSFREKLHELGRRPSASQLRKRRGSNADETAPDGSQQGDRRESRDSLAPLGRTSSWGINKKPMPNLNTALVGIATGAATIGTSHARNGSISATSITSPKSPFLPTVKNPLRRPRSKTELPRESHPNLMGMLKQAGGPPVARLARSRPTLDQDDDDDDDDTFEDIEMKTELGKLEKIVPTFSGFQEHIWRLNPSLANTNTFLVDRIAHQMIVRFKNLQGSNIKHLKLVKQRSCSCGTLCIAQGGSAIPLNTTGDTRGVDPLSTQPDSSDGDNTPLEGGINPESFPPGIPMPPTPSLPAEFECQLCYELRRFQKPSDWTKHVHEDIQPFTCTWDKCRDPKMFKRKADWVRHENEGHRHLEWWMCDVEDCRHTCFRRDNFLQHLVREHKFAEPKVKTKAAIKKAGGADSTWQKVEKCHVETPKRPQDEPCRFCGKTFPTWKKLTVHLAKHMEQISLPVLRLVADEDLDADTIISPVQDPPPRNFPPLPIKHDPYAPSPQRPHALSNPNPVDFQHQPNLFGYQSLSRPQMHSSYYDQQQTSRHFDRMPQTSGLMMPQVTTGFSQQQQYHALPVTTGPSYGQSTHAYLPMQGSVEPFSPFNSLNLQDNSGGQMSYDGLADPITLQTVEQYSNQGSVSPYGHSPHQGPGGFYNP